MQVIGWFKNLSPANKIAIVVPVVVVVIGGVFGLLKALPKKTIPQDIDIVAEGNKGTINIAGRDIHTGIESEAVLNTLVETSAKLGRSEKENENLKERVRQLEAQLAQPYLEATIASQQSTPVPSREAKELAKLINENDGPYAQALKAIAEGNTEQADEFLDQTQQLIDRIQQQKDQAQAKIYFARMQNAFYGGKYQDALGWCDKLHSLAGEDPQILNLMGLVYNKNAMYEKAEPLYQRALAVREKALGKDHPDVAISLGNLAALYHAQGKYAQAEPLYQRALAVMEKALGKDHPDVATCLNNLASLYHAQGKYAQAEPLYQRALAVREKALGKDHPDVATCLNNLAELYYAQGKYAQAEPLYKRALAILENSLGPDHPNTITVRKNLDNCRKR